VIRLESAHQQDLVSFARREGGWEAGNAAGLMERLLSTVMEEQFPGAIIPRHVDGHFRYYLLASSEADWRLLRPLALAFVGRTISTFDGSRSVLSSEDPFEAKLLAADLICARLVATGSTPAERRRVATALDELRTLATSARAPRQEFRTTADILRDFGLALAVRDRSAAEHSIDLLRENLRLDGLNQVFMRIEVDASVEAWSDLWARSYYVDACRALRPPRVTSALARAAYWTTLDGPAATGDLEELRQSFKTTTAPRTQGLFTGLPPVKSLDVVLPFLLGWDLAGESARLPEELRAAVDSWPDGPRRCALQLVGEAATRLPVPQPPVAEKAPSSADGLRNVVFEAIMRRTPDALSAAQAALLDADPALVGQLRAATLYRDAVNLILDHVPTTGIISWVDWAGQITQLDPREVVAWAREAVVDRPLWEELGDHIALETFVARLDKAMGDVPEVAGLALPFVLDAVLSDPDWPQVEFQSLYRQLLDLVLFDETVTQSKVASVSRLTAGLLTIGLDAGAYARTIRDVADWVTNAASVLTLDRLIDLGEVTITYPCRDEPARNALWARVILAIRPFQARLDAVQKRLLVDIDAVIGGDAQLASMLEEPAAQVASEQKGRDAGVPARPAPKVRVALYSLVESMAKRTKDILERAYPALEVQLSTGEVADRRLEQQAREADLFVICWTRATHAATNAIRARRGDRPLLYASGAGSASLTREVVEKLGALGFELESA